jgi:hypothetical protein
MARKKQEFKSLREALIASCTAEPRPVKDVIADALKKHPLKGATPAATASSELLRMQRAGLVSKPERGMVAR